MLAVIGETFFSLVKEWVMMHEQQSFLYCFDESAFFNSSFTLLLKVMTEKGSRMRCRVNFAIKIQTKIM